MGSTAPPVDPNMPNFIYPPNQISSDSNAVSLDWNYLDNVNVSWTAADPNQQVDYQPYLALWWQDNGGQLYQIQNTTIATSGSRTYNLNIGLAYPAAGLFEIIYAWPNGTNQTGPASQFFNVVQDSSQTPQIWGATASKAAPTSSSTPTSTPPLPTASSSPSTNSTPSLSGGTIAGIVIGALAGAALLAVLAFFLTTRLRRRKQAAYATLQTKEAQLNNIYASASSEAEQGKAELATSGPPRRGRFVELITSMTSPRELHAPWSGKREVEGVAEMQGEEGYAGAAAELPGNYHETGSAVEIGGRSPAEMEGRRW